MSKRRSKKQRQRLDEVQASSMETARFMQEKRTNDCTKTNYKSKLNVLTTWIKQHHPDALNNDGTIAIPVASNVIIDFFGDLSAKAVMMLNSSDDESSELPTPMSVSGVRGYRSALVDMYRSHSLKLDEQLDLELTCLLDGYEKAITELKSRGRMSIHEGKRHLKWTGYLLLARKFMTKIPTDGANGLSWSTIVFGWSFCVIMWNLMSRTESVDRLMLQHIEWDGDALIIEEQMQKGDQRGENKFGKHLYANPDQPEICPVLALGLLLFCYPNRPNGKQQLFAGTNSKDRFHHLLNRLLQSIEFSELQLLGCPIKDIGTHSLRKGSSTHALGQVCGPTPVSVFLRMGQTLGQLKDRYVHNSEGADQLCGRMVSGLPFDNEQFAILPPHFPNTIVTKLNPEFWNNLLSGYSTYPNGIKGALPFLLASVVHHEDFLRSNLDPNHPIFTSRLFTSNPLF